MTVLKTTNAIGDTGLTAFLDLAATQVNTNTTNIATNTSDIALRMVKTANLSDVASVATAKANLGLGDAIIAMPAATACRIWPQATDPDTTNPGVAANGDIWVSPAS